MPYWQIETKTDKQIAPEIEEMLFSIGACSVAFCEPDNEEILLEHGRQHKLWQHINIQSVFDTEPDLKILTTKYEKLSFSCQKLVTKNWEENWEQHQQPIQFGKIEILPTTNIQPKKNLTPVYISSGLAFGSGSHQTTQLCIEFLESVNLKNKVVVDWGCGSGILAIIALKLGAKHAYCTDIDSQALYSCQENAKKNGIDPSMISIYKCEEFNNQLPADIILANILLKPLLNLSDVFKTQILKTNNCQLALSGIIKEQLDNLQNHYKWLNNVDIKKLNNWILMSGKI